MYNCSVEEQIMEVWVYEMYMEKTAVEQPYIACIPFSGEYKEEYMSVYNACFRPMREALDIRPYDWYTDGSRLEGKTDSIFLLVENDHIIGSVACYGNEIDDLIVKASEQKKGYGKQLLLWAMQHIWERNDEPITLHVAAWNQGALRLYKRTGFQVKKKERVR